MTDRMIENRVKKIQDLEKQKAEIESEIEKIKAELKEDMESKEVDVIHTEKGVTIRWQEIVSDRFDSKNFTNFILVTAGNIQFFNFSFNN